MSVSNIRYFEVWDCFDPEGKGPKETIAFFWEHGEAVKFSKGRGNYGKDAFVKIVDVSICDTTEDLEEYKTEVLKKKALAKLTEDERKLLGF